MVPQSRPSEDGEVNTSQARPNALDPTMTFRPNGQTSQFSPMLISSLMALLAASYARLLDTNED